MCLYVGVEIVVLGIMNAIMHMLLSGERKNRSLGYSIFETGEKRKLERGRTTTIFVIPFILTHKRSGSSVE